MDIIMGIKIRTLIMKVSLNIPLDLQCFFFFIDAEQRKHIDFNNTHLKTSSLMSIPF